MKRILLIPVILLVLQGCNPAAKYTGTAEVTKWEPDIAAFEQLDRSVKYPDGALLFAGSSSIRLWETIVEDMAPYSVIKRGYGGSKLSDFAIYADRIFSPHRPGAAVLFIANDIAGTPEDKTPEEAMKLLKYVYKRFRKFNPETPFFWVGITPTGLRWNSWPEIKRFNTLARDFFIKEENSYYIDTESYFLDSAGNPRSELFRDDRLHLNEEGYRIWSSIIKKEIMSVL